MSFFNFAIKDITGKVLKFHTFKGKKAFLVVNVASEWDYTSSYYKALSSLYSDLEHKGLEIIGCPCNQFGAQ